MGNKRCHIPLPALTMGDICGLSARLGAVDERLRLGVCSTPRMGLDEK